MAIKESSKKSPMPVLIFMRHGARAFDGDQLSLEGKKQALALGNTLRTKRVSLPTQLFSSPKKRTQATLATLAIETGVRVQIDPRLDERLGGESEQDFENRVKSVLQECDDWAATTLHTETRLICSHLDWLEAAAVFLTSDETDLERSEPWSPLAIRTYEYDGVWRRQNSRGGT